MTPRKGRDRRPNNHNHNHNQHQRPQPSDYESDTPYYFSDTQQQQAAVEMPPPPPTRSNEELNISVLRRHNPAITSILSLAPYAVVYVFSPVTRQWEKSGVEGGMFVCQLTQGAWGEERYGVFVLNRRGLNNFDIRLTDGENVEITDEFVILKTDEEDNAVGGGEAPSSQIYGLWIYSEPPPNSTAETRKLNAQVIKECAVHAGESLKLARERAEAERQNGHHQELYSSVPMGRQMSLKELFGQQRAQDDEWSVKVHSHGLAEPEQQQPPFWGQQAQAQTQVPGPGPATGPTPAMHTQPGGDVLGDLFRRAGLAYQSG
ncbi:hypothetical protein VTN77DRAFT_2953 [Rasamsonia byssochlamydoides]|uniref:uncharacterized protein n=1 Tax=Rasamsonia byssochlamydoides TaxID=89139 RepID=UPI0037445AD5